MHDFGKPQKALHLHLDEALKTPKHQGRTYGVMEKFDGWFMYVDILGGEYQGIRSKTGRRLISMGKYDNILFNRKMPNIDLRLIFEAVIPQESGPRGYMEFKDCNGKFNQTNHQLQDVVFKCHDLLTIKPKTFERRYADLAKLLNVWGLNQLHQVPILVRSELKSYWLECYNSIVDCGGEGVILKDLAAHYSPNKRNAEILKIKCEVTLEALVVGTKEGKPGGKYVGTIGTLVVRTKNGVLNNVSGMSDKQRALWWTNPDLILGKVVECSAMKILEDGRFREGRFKAVRFDKTEKDID